MAHRLAELCSKGLSRFAPDVIMEYADRLSDILDRTFLVRGDLMENGAQKNIERVTEAIFNVLYHEGDLDLQELRKKVDAPSHIFDMAIGSLVEKDDVTLVQMEGPS
jgi:nitrogen-specific signal transduction histidine kinase